ncbi:MAG: peptidyl-tRNA hydrolase Pth2 [Candidatus Micrarchaeota archaeon]|nr:peptidyl-tRNA hydrolase Pth2 [Candidatus Micrarchaeota archaeon]
MQYKQAIVVRKDIDMGKGKTCAQVSHASLEAYIKSDKETRESWRMEGARKVVVKCDTLEQLEDLFQSAQREGLTCVKIIDAGRTQLEPGTTTCIGIGPDDEKKVDKVIGKLKLL